MRKLSHWSARNYRNLVAKFGREEDCGFVIMFLDTFSSQLSCCLHPDVVINSVRQTLVHDHEFVRISEIVSVRASTLAVAAQERALTLLGYQDEFCPSELASP
jgi:hypothetical protein